MEISGKKLVASMLAILITSIAVSSAVVLKYTELRETTGELFVDIDTDRSPAGIEPFTINLSANVVNAKGKVIYDWDLGDGRKARGKEVEVTYEEPGIYNCKIIVTDETGRKAEDSLQIIVEKNKPPVISLSINIQNVDRIFKWLNLLSLIPGPLAWAGNQQLVLDQIEKTKGPWAWGESGIVITAQVTDPEGDEIVLYEWKEQTADKLVTITGKTLLPVHNLSGNSTVKIPALYAWMIGRHIVTLTVKDSAGNTATANIDYMVSESTTEVRLKMLSQFALTFVANQVLEKLIGIITQQLQEYIGNEGE